MMAMTFVVDEFNVSYAAEREKSNTTPSEILHTEGTTVFILSRSDYGRLSEIQPQNDIGMYKIINENHTQGQKNGLRASNT
jgi:hypothetical protein